MLKPFAAIAAAALLLSPSATAAQELLYDEQGRPYIDVYYPADRTLVRTAFVNSSSSLTAFFTTTGDGAVETVILGYTGSWDCVNGTFAGRQLMQIESTLINTVTIPGRPITEAEFILMCN